MNSLPPCILVAPNRSRSPFGPTPTQYTSPVWDLLWYVIDNEIHHRGQGYVYLRGLGIEPPPFYVRD